MRSFASPFYSRNYGGFSLEQIRFLHQYSEGDRPRRILDPMSGQAHYLAELVWRGHDIWLGDINPGPLLLANLRDPILVMQAENLKTFLLRQLDTLAKQSVHHKPAYSEEWIPEILRDELRKYATGFSIFDSCSTTPCRGMWSARPEVRFAASLPVLAARQIACYTASDNLTWLKRGGLQTSFSIYPALFAALHQWIAYAADASKRFRGVSPGRLHIDIMNAESGNLGEGRLPNLIVTSPPYANRLDYTRLWGPELEVFAAMAGLDTSSVKSDQIGTTVVTKRRPTTADISSLPNFIQHVLEAIRSDGAHKASESYYHPFFANYAFSLHNGFKHIGQRLQRNGHIVVFIRDTIRKDVLFPAGKLVEETLKSVGVDEIVEKKEVIIRHHVGLRRKDAQSGMYGLAQREWWLVMRKR